MNIQDFENLFKLDYDSFDQDVPSGGWRGIEDEFQAAMIVDAYHLQYFEELNLTQHRMLYWHAGQCYALEGVTKLAVDRFKKGIMTEEQADYKARWNAYAEGTIAFLEKDLEKLKIARDELKRVDPDNDGTLVILNNMIAGFGKSYSEVY
jgi:hypothetical protein